MDKLFGDLNQSTQKTALESVHLAQWPKSKFRFIDTDLEEQMRLAQDLTSMVFSLRKKENLRVRQPLQKMMVPVLDDKIKSQIEAVKELVLSEVNVKELEFMTSDSDILIKKVKPNYKSLGPKFGQQIKAISQAISQFTTEDISTIEQVKSCSIEIGDSEVQIELDDVIITTEDIPGWAVTSINGNTVALDINLNDNLISEGLAREVVNRIQNLRKELGFEVTDRIEINLSAEEKLAKAINNNLNYICSETLADELNIIAYNFLEKVEEIELTEGVFTRIELLKR